MSEKANKIFYIAASLLLAIAFWLYADNALGNTIKREFVNVPIDFIGAEDTLPSRGLMLASGEDATLDLTISGPRTVISSLDAGDIRGQVNVTSISAAGPYSLPCTLYYPDNVNTSDITIERRSRNNVSFQVTGLYSREIPVNINVIGGVQEPYVYMANRWVVEPSTLTISGLQDSVDEVASARVVVDISNATETIQQEYSYELLDSEGNVLEDPDVRASDQRVSVTVPIHMVKEVPVTVKFKESPGSTLENVKWDLEPKAITISGEPLSLEGIDEINLGEVDLSAYDGNQEIELEIKLPGGCENASGQKTAKLSIEFNGLTTRSITATNIIASGLSVSQSFDLITTSLDVVLRGPAADLEQVTPEDIRVVVDLKDITADGTVSPEPNIYVDGFRSVGALKKDYSITGKIISS